MTRRRTVVTGAAFTLVASVAAACGAFGESGSSTPTPDAAADDGGTSADGSSVTDAGPPFTDDAGRTCTPMLKTDFSSMPTELTATQNNNGQHSLSQDKRTSAPSSLYFTVTVDPQNDNDETVEHTFTLGSGVSASDVLQVEYDVYLVPTATAYTELGCSLAIEDSGGKESRIFLARSSDGNLDTAYQASNGTTPAKQRLLASFTEGWFHVRHELSIPQSGTLSATTTLPAPAKPGTLSIPLPTAPTGLRILCGIDYASFHGDAGSAQVEVWIDDLNVRRCTP